MNRKSKSTQSVTALYCRLSIEDGRENESMSIQNQKAMLRDFAEKNGLLGYEYYVEATVIIGLSQQTLDTQGVAPVKSYLFAENTAGGDRQKMLKNAVSVFSSLMADTAYPFDKGGCTVWPIYKWFWLRQSN